MAYTRIYMVYKYGVLLACRKRSRVAERNRNPNNHDTATAAFWCDIALLFVFYMCANNKSSQKCQLRALSASHKQNRIVLKRWYMAFATQSFGAKLEVCVQNIFMPAMGIYINYSVCIRLEPKNISQNTKFFYKTHHHRHHLHHTIVTATRAMLNKINAVLQHFHFCQIEHALAHTDTHQLVYIKPQIYVK